MRCLRFLFAVLFCLGGLSAHAAQPLRDLNGLELVPVRYEIQEEGWLQSAEPDPYLVFEGVLADVLQVKGVRLRIQFQEPLSTRSYWEIYWGSFLEGYNEATKLFFTAGRRGDTSIDVWLPLGQHPLFRKSPIQDIRHFRLSPALRFQQAFKIESFEVWTERPLPGPRTEPLYAYGRPDFFLNSQNPSELLSRGVESWLRRWPEDWVFAWIWGSLVIGNLVFMGWLARRPRNRQTVSK